jgi:hypothetical protein
MRHIACGNDECVNKGAPYFDFEPDLVIVACPVCGSAMVKIPTPAEAAPEPEGDA